MTRAELLALVAAERAAFYGDNPIFAAAPLGGEGPAGKPRSPQAAGAADPSPDDGGARRPLDGA